MTDRELLNEVNSKIEALTPRIDALETAAAGAVSHDEVQAVVDAESAIEGRVVALESKFQGTPVTSDSAPDSAPVTEDVAAAENHTIS